MFQRDLGFVEKTITDVAKQTGVMLLLDMSGANAMIAADPNTATRNLKRGLAFYLGRCPSPWPFRGVAGAGISRAWQLGTPTKVTIPNLHRST